MDTYEQRLERLAQNITDRAKTVNNGLHLSLSVQASGCINICFDQGENVSPEKLRRAVFENFLNLMHLHEELADGLIDDVQIEDAYDE